VILLATTVLAVTWKYFGTPEFYREGIAPWIGLDGDPQLLAAVYCFAAGFVLLGLVPALIVKFVFHQRLAEYGVQLGIRKRTFRTMAILVPLFVLGGYLGSFDAAMRAYYPINHHAGASGAMFALHAASYLLLYLGYEFGMRGFLQFGLRGSMGDVNALLVQVFASCVLHFGRPASETYLSILAGLFWGILAFRTRSLLSGLVQHFGLALSLDWFLCFGT
jgi:uncharacterized protein